VLHSISITVARVLTSRHFCSISIPTKCNSKANSISRVYSAEISAQVGILTGFQILSILPSVDVCYFIVPPNFAKDLYIPDFVDFITGELASFVRSEIPFVVFGHFIANRVSGPLSVFLHPDVGYVHGSIDYPISIFE
jgi:hypothetical protein